MELGPAVNVPKTIPYQPKGTLLHQGVRKIQGIRDLQPMSPLEGNVYFRGAGNHLPSGAPEVVINSIPTIDNAAVTTVLKVEIKK